MKPDKKSPAHHANTFAEIVCSNSLKSNEPSTASGTLKQELEILDCLLLKIANECKVPAGSALAVDRELFTKKVTEYISGLENLETDDTMMSLEKSSEAKFDLAYNSLKNILERI